MTIGENIRYFRKKRSLTQKQLAEKTGVNEVTIRSYENGRYIPKQKNLIKLAQALQVNIYNLLDEDGVELFNTYTEEEIERFGTDEMMVCALPSSILQRQVERKAKEDENTLLSNYWVLNEAGRNEAQKRVQELTEIKKYTEPEEE